MTEVISVRFKDKGKVYFFAPGSSKVADGDAVIVETSKGLEYAVCSWGNHWVDDTAVVQPLRPVVRVATKEDTRRYENNKQNEQEAFRICQEKILSRGLDMKLVDVEYNFEGSKILFFFTSDGRVDFRELVKDLAGIFHTRIELRQIGVRDEAKMVGGLGICGRPFCCSQFLDDFHPVSIKMAKTQGLSLNPTKISGTCGRLMCCLKYEQLAYEDLVKKAPKMDAFVDTPGGKGSVVTINLLRSYAKVRLEDSTDTIPKTYPFDELEILGGKARRAEYIAARDSGRLEEAGFTPSQIRKSRLEEEPAKAEEAPFVFADGSVAVPRPEPAEEIAGEHLSRNNRNKRSRKPRHGQDTPELGRQETGRENKPNRPGKPGNQKPRPAGNGAPRQARPKPEADSSPAAGSNQPGEGKKNPRSNNYRRYNKKRSGSKPGSGSASQS